MFRNSYLIPHTIYSQQVKESRHEEEDLVELGKGKEGLGGIFPTPISIALETGVGPQQESLCSRDAERFILSPGRWQGVPAPTWLRATGRRALKGPRGA